MSIDVYLNIAANAVTFLVCTGAILSHKIKDGVVIKAGLILLAFSSLYCMRSPPTPAELITNMGVGLISAGIFLRIKVYPIYFKYTTYICNICDICNTMSTSLMKRRASDRVKETKVNNDVNTGSV